ncbi:MAG: hypothetical protein AB8B97_08160 [Granulosicoccus sp.]
MIKRCPILGTIKDRQQAERLVAALDIKNSRPMDYLAYEFDIVLRGRRQTRFENRPEGL